MNEDKKAYRTCCRECAKKIPALLRAYERAMQHVLSGFGPDSVCDFCGEENGGAVISFTK